jgi:hypothetical protein
MTHALPFLVLLLNACSDPAKPTDDTAGGEDSAGGDSGTDTAPEDTGSDFPAEPAGFTIQLSGARSDTLVFDELSCSLNAANLRVFWRNAADAHVFVLIAEIMGRYAGPGGYDDTTGVRLKLQEEAGGTLAYFAADPASGDTVAVEITAGDAYTAAGTATVGGMRGAEGTLSFAPASWPLWCVTEPPP